MLMFDRRAKSYAPHVQVVALIITLASIVWQGGRMQHQLEAATSAIEALRQVVSDIARVQATVDAEQAQRMADISRRLTLLEERR